VNDEIRDQLIGIFVEYNPRLAHTIRHALRQAFSRDWIESAIRDAAQKHEEPDGSLTQNMALLYLEWLIEDASRAKEPQ
jgi:hypothetical protein